MAKETALGIAQVPIRATLDELEKDLEQARSKIEKSMGSVWQKIGGPLAKIGTAAVATGLAGIVAGVTAIGGAAGVAANAFIPFQNSMNEVFTLLPDLSADAMGQMSDDALQLARDMGVLPNRVVPALYQAISAGVPQDNVFSFLETAQKAAVGGVTELETAVDGISSVVNAYGAEVLGATQASDLMFTAVRLGKTTFGELAGSLFQVAPVAAALGVEFGDVTAGLAAMTGQGVPTSVATTQLRQALVEMSKEGSKTASLFQSLSGQTFREFIAAGGNVQGALQILEGGAADLGVGINDLFGSVEAGNAALALTGRGTAVFTTNLEAMAAAAGATDAAYGTMDQGISRTLDKIKAQGQAFLISVGDRMAPVLAQVADTVLQLLVPAFDRLVPIMETYLVPVIERVSEALGLLVQGDAAGALETLFGEEIAGKILTVAQTMQAFIENTLIPFVTEHAEALKAALLGIGGVIMGAMVIGAIKALVIAIVAINWPLVAVIAAVGLLAAAWTQDWGGIRTFLTNVWENHLQPILSRVAEWLQEKVPQALEFLSNVWENVLLPAIKAVWGFFDEYVIPLLVALAGVYLATVQVGFEVLAALWENVVLPALKDVWQWVTDLATAIGEGLTPVLEWLNEKVLGPVTNAFSGLGDKVKDVIGWIGGLAEKIGNLSLPSWLTPGSPTPFENGLVGISEAMRKLSATELPRFQMRLERGILGAMEVGRMDLNAQLLAATAVPVETERRDRDGDRRAGVNVTIHQYGELDAGRLSGDLRLIGALGR